MKVMDNPCAGYNLLVSGGCFHDVCIHWSENMNNVPSTAAQVIVTIIPISGIVVGSVVVFFYLMWGYKSKKALIEKGLYRRTEFDIDTFSLFAGLILTGIGVSLTVFFLIRQGFSYGVLSGLIPLSTGVSLIVFYAVRGIRRTGNGD